VTKRPGESSLSGTGIQFLYDKYRRETGTVPSSEGLFRIIKKNTGLLLVYRKKPEPRTP